MIGWLGRAPDLLGRTFGRCNTLAKSVIDPATRRAERHTEATMAETKKDPNEGRDGYELYDGKWRKVVDGRRTGWWRFNEHYDRDGYCDNPGRGY